MANSRDPPSAYVLRPQYNRKLILAGFILLLIAAYSLNSTYAVHPYQSTFNILAGRFFKIGANLRDRTTVTGQFRETSNRLITFQLMSSPQFAAFQANQSIGALISLPDVSTGSFAWTSSLPDTYYMVFVHGSGLSATTETVNFQRTYTSLDEFQLAAGIITGVLGALELYWGLRPRKGPPTPPFPQ